MNWPSGVYSGPSSSPGWRVRFVSSPVPSDGDLVDVELAVPPAGVDEGLRPSGDQPWKYEGVLARDPLRRAAGRGQGVDGGLAVACGLVADAQPRPVEGEDVVVVVAHRGPRVDGGRRPRGEVEAVEPPAALGAAGGVVDERAPVPRPVRRLEGLGRAVDHLPVPRPHVEDLEAASEVVPVRDEALAGRAVEAHVAEDGALHHLRVVRAERRAPRTRRRRERAPRPAWSRTSRRTGRPRG